MAREATCKVAGRAWLCSALSFKRTISGRSLLSVPTAGHVNQGRLYRTLLGIGFLVARGRSAWTEWGGFFFFFFFFFKLPMIPPTPPSFDLSSAGPQTRGRYHGGRRPSSDDSFHSATVIPPAALDKPSIMKLDHRRRPCSHTSPRRSPTMVTLHDTGFVECRWWNDGWTVKTVVT